MLGKFVWKKQANIKKGKGKKKKKKETKNINVFQKVVDAQKEYKNGLLKRKTKAKKKQNRKKWNTLRQAFCGNKIDKNL